MATTKKAPAKTGTKSVVAKKIPAKKTAAKHASSKRTLVEPHAGDKRYVRRDGDGQFKESDDVSRSLAQDVRKKATTVSKPGQGDRGDAKRPAAKKSASKKAASKRSASKKSASGKAATKTK